MSTGYLLQVDAADDGMTESSVNQEFRLMSNARTSSASNFRIEDYAEAEALNNTACALANSGLVTRFDDIPCNVHTQQTADQSGSENVWDCVSGVSDESFWLTDLLNW